MSKLTKWNFLVCSVMKWARANRPDLIEACNAEWHRLNPEQKRPQKNSNDIPEFLKHLK